MATLTIVLSDAEQERLEALAKARRRSTIQCVRDFIATCQPGGGTHPWTHPANATDVKVG